MIDPSLNKKFVITMYTIALMISQCVLYYILNQKETFVEKPTSIDLKTIFMILGFTLATIGYLVQAYGFKGKSLSQSFPIIIIGSALIESCSVLGFVASMTSGEATNMFYFNTCAMISLTYFCFTLLRIKNYEE